MTRLLSIFSLVLLLGLSACNVPETTIGTSDGVQPSEFFKLKVTRDATGGTASPGDAELFFVEVQLQ